MPTPQRTKPRLLALDVDGTLTDPQGRVRPVVIERVREARDLGVEVVLCTGRRYRTALPVLEALDLHGPVIVHNGILVKDARSGRTLEHAYLPQDVYTEALQLMHALQPPIVYLDGALDETDMWIAHVEAGDGIQSRYLRRNADHYEITALLDRRPERGVVVMSSLAERAQLEPLRARIERALGDRVHTNLIMNKSDRGHILEVVAPRTGKWPALERVARELGIAASEIVAVGDDANDLQMVEAAGVGVAMANAVEAVLRAADHVTESNAEDGVARAIERFVLDA